MAVQNNLGYGFYWEYNEDGGPMPVTEVTLDTNISVSEGDPIAIEADGYANVAGSNSSIYGFALEDITGAASTYKDVAVVKATAQAVFSGYTDGAGAVTNIGDATDITGSTGAFTIDDDGTTHAVIRITKLHPVSDDYGTNAQFYFKVLKSQIYGAG